MQPATEAFQDLSILLDWDENNGDDTDDLLLNYDGEQSPILPLQPTHHQHHHHKQQHKQQQRQRRHAKFSVNSPDTPAFCQEKDDDDDDDGRRRHYHQYSQKPPEAENLKDNAIGTSSTTPSFIRGGGGEGARYPLLLGGEGHDDDDHGRDAWNERVDKLLHFVENYEFSKTPAKTTPATNKPREASSATAAANDSTATTTTTIRRNDKMSDDSFCSRQINGEKKAEQLFFRRRRHGSRSKKNGENFVKDSDHNKLKSKESSVTANTTSPTVSASAATTTGGEQYAASPLSFHQHGQGTRSALTGISGEFVTRGMSQHNDKGSTAKNNVVVVVNGEDNDEKLSTAAEDLWQEAQQERQAARTWANQVRAAASKWIREQEELQKLLQLQLEQQQQECADQMKAASSPTATNNIHHHQNNNNNNTMITLELHQKVQQLEDELDQSRQRHLAIQEQLHCIIDDQQERIQYLEQQLLEIKQQQQLAQQVTATGNKDVTFWMEQQCRLSNVATKRMQSSPLLSPAADGQSQQHQQQGLVVVEERKQQRELFTTNQQQPHQSAATMDESSPRSVFPTTTPFPQQRLSQADNESPQGNDNVNNQSMLISPESVELPPAVAASATTTAAAAFDHACRDLDLLTDGKNNNQISQGLGHCSKVQKNDQHHLSHPPMSSSPSIDEPQTQAQQPSRRQRRRCRLKTPEGHDVIQYANGTRKEIHADGTTILRFANGDIQTNSGGDSIGSSTAYYFAATNVLRLVQADKNFTLYEYPNGQIEQHWHDETGRKVVHLPDGTRYEVLVASSSSIQ